MSKKTELLQEAKTLGLEVSDKNTIAQLEKMLKDLPRGQVNSETGNRPTAKAGKRSRRSVKAAEEREAKEERKKQVNSPNDKPISATQTKMRSKSERKGKKYQDSYNAVDHNKLYSPKDALDLIKSISKSKFDQTVELHVNLSVDPRHADQNVRDSILLPAGSGKIVRIAVLADPDEAKLALAEGADIAGVAEITDLLEKGALAFDILIATPSQMPKLGKYARLLGPKGLMPNPKSNTVTSDVATAVKEAKAGRVEYRVDSNGIVHVGIGKIGFSSENLLTNFSAIMGSIKSNKPSNSKGIYIKSCYLTSTMGPSVRVDTASF